MASKWPQLFDQYLMTGDNHSDQCGSLFIETCNWLDILVQVEYILRIIFGLERNESLVVRTVAARTRAAPSSARKLT